MTDTFEYTDHLVTPQSELATAVFYNRNSEELVIQFRESGAKWLYENFLVEDWNDLLDADSVGRFYNEYIKGHYHSSEMDEETAMQKVPTPAFKVGDRVLISYDVHQTYKGKVWDGPGTIRAYYGLGLYSVRTDSGNEGAFPEYNLSPLGESDNATGPHVHFDTSKAIIGGTLTAGNLNIAPKSKYTVKWLNGKVPRTVDFRADDETDALRQFNTSIDAAKTVGLVKTVKIESVTHHFD